MRGPARGSRGARSLAVLGIGTLVAGLFLAIAAPAAADCSGKCDESGDTTTSTVTSSSSGGDGSTTTQTTTVLTTLTTTSVSTDETSTVLTTVTSTSGLPAPNSIAARTHWSGSVGGTATVWLTKPGLEGADDAISDPVVIDAGDDLSFAALQFETVDGGDAFAGVQIHQQLSSPGSYLQPTAVIDSGDYGPFELTGPECSGTECVWTVEYVSSLRARTPVLRAAAGPFRGPVVTITNVGRPTGGGTRAPTPTTSASTTTATPATAATTPTTPAPEVLGESSSMAPAPIAAPQTTVIAPALAATGVAADRYTSLAVLLILLGAVMLIIASGGLWRRDRN